MLCIDAKKFYFDGKKLCFDTKKLHFDSDKFHFGIKKLYPDGKKLRIKAGPLLFNPLIISKYASRVLDKSEETC